MTIPAKPLSSAAGNCTCVALVNPRPTSVTVCPGTTLKPDAGETELAIPSNSTNAGGVYVKPAIVAEPPKVVIVIAASTASGITNPPYWLLRLPVTVGAMLVFFSESVTV